ncbi:MAG: alpha/beta hydrolase [Methylophilus sp.]|nr:alpha/beta hydrolase [Methylophilus sp.]
MIKQNSVLLSQSLKYLLILSVLSGCASTETMPTQQDGKPNIANYRIIGSHKPVIVMQAGLGDGKEVWDSVTPELSRDNTTFAFDRPGRAKNPPTNAPRDVCTIASEQRALLQTLGLKPPYILVGHSLGGLYQFAFAKLYPAEVAGMVLVDPTPPNHWERMQKEAPEAAMMIKGLRLIAFSSTDRREFDAQADCLERLDFNHPLNVPTKVLVSGRFTGAGEKGDFEKMMKQSRQQWVKLTNASKLDVVWDSGHYIQKESPESVVSAVTQVVADVSRK